MELSRTDHFGGEELSSRPQGRFLKPPTESSANCACVVSACKVFRKQPRAEAKYRDLTASPATRAERNDKRRRTLALALSIYGALPPDKDLCTLGCSSPGAGLPSHSERGQEARAAHHACAEQRSPDVDRTTVGPSPWGQRGGCLSREACCVATSSDLPPPAQWPDRASGAEARGAAGTGSP